ncbi:cation-transporting P-type ATPase [Streptomyces sp. NPDC046931]|uniref:cation-transporting P-type ATPase n=1 Tax=Streptomyces sp. NPDC046931 TaxID=3154806 RepID=UPI00340C79A6
MPEGGLSSEEAARRLKRWGPNAVHSHRARVWPVLWHQLRSPLLGLLLAARRGRHGRRLPAPRRARQADLLPDHGSTGSPRTCSRPPAFAPPRSTVQHRHPSAAPASPPPSAGEGSTPDGHDRVSPRARSSPPVCVAFLRGRRSR